MKQKEKKPQKRKPEPGAGIPPAPELRLKKKNYLLLLVGVATITAGFISLARGETTIAPLLLVVGYCVLIPLALLLK